jgi:hypothetical protein
MNTMRESVRTNDVNRWATTFLGRLQEATPLRSAESPRGAARQHNGGKLIGTVQ